MVTTSTAAADPSASFPSLPPYHLSSIHITRVTRSHHTHHIFLFLSYISDTNSLNMVNQTFTCISLLCMLGLLINKNADKTTANDYNRWCSSSNCNNNNNNHHVGSSGGGAAAYEEYRHLLIGTLRYAISKLNQKAIYANMVAFSSKVLGACPLSSPLFLTLYYIEISFVYPCAETK